MARRTAVVTLRRMTAEEFGTWKEGSIASYAGDLAHANHEPLDAAIELARQQFLELLPNGLASERNWLLKILDETAADVGTLWVGAHPEHADTAFVYEIEIAEAYRGRRLGTAAMIAAETLVAEAGFARISLNVFGFNEAARQLYDSLGYSVVSTRMTKSLDHGAGEYLTANSQE